MNAVTTSPNHLRLLNPLSFRNPFRELSEIAEFPPLFEGERRQATVLFSDLSGYTAMNEQLDPEEVEEIMTRIKKESVRIVESYGGIVNQFVGDEILALFGIPTGHEDDPISRCQSCSGVA